jgi:chromosome segregation ATPase
MRALLPIAALLLVSCGSELEDRVSELEAENADLQYALQNARNALSDTRDAIDAASEQASETQSEAERFSYEDWSDVVSDVQSDANETVVLVENASSSLEEAESATEVY